MPVMAFCEMSLPHDGPMNELVTFVDRHVVRLGQRVLDLGRPASSVSVDGLDAQRVAADAS